jgi:hypothetical protein
MTISVIVLLANRKSPKEVFEMQRTVTKKLGSNHGIALKYLIPKGLSFVNQQPNWTSLLYAFFVSN